MEDLETIEGASSPSAAPDSSCAEKLERSDWLGTHVLQLDDLRLGVRWNDRDVGVIVGDLFDAYRVGGEQDHSPDFSLVHQDEDDGAAYALHRHDTMLIKSDSLNRVLHGLIRYVDELRTGATPGRLRLAATAVVGSSGVVLAPLSMRRDLLRVEDQLNVRGYMLLDASWVVVHPEAAELVWEPPGLEVDRSSVLIGPLEPGASRHRIRALLLPSGADDAGPFRRARSVRELASMVVDPTDLGASASLGALQEVVDRVEVVGIAPLNDEDLVALFTRFAGS